ncbi:hypothetical protein [Crateriforma conspicua]|uniref:Uncharacterized protein n=1 Tax=Crateriforma conspicua TaxID=2527996 RepID=A0A5C5Y7W1_9PLAN|nr:hypothetical protein [Crateriforma conspicua]QDV62067.1 hypothetical protein Mal65_11950 [Crateriforma conspicua]TWT71766.1 hypothetical protein Pan14r_40820 [Crateriforma conspicua]
MERDAGTGENQTQFLHAETVVDFPVWFFLGRGLIPVTNAG